MLQILRRSLFALFYIIIIMLVNLLDQKDDVEDADGWMDGWGAGRRRCLVFFICSSLYSLLQKPVNDEAEEMRGEEYVPS